MKKASIMGIFALALAVLAITGCKANTGNAVYDADVGIVESASERPAEGGLVKIPISDFSTDIIKYSYKKGDVTIRYLTILGSDGKPRVAFDTCSTCNVRGSYEKVGAELNCKACGQSFPIDDIGTGNAKEGCFPSYLEYGVSGSDVIIKVSDLEAGAGLFS